MNGQPEFEGVNIPPPYVLERDDVISLRFRVRRGIDWSARWNLDALRSFCKDLENEIAVAHGQLIWRRGDRVLRDKFEVPLVVEQQALFVQLLRQLTEDFTVRPNLGERYIQIE